MGFLETLRDVMGVKAPREHPNRARLSQAWKSRVDEVEVIDEEVGALQGASEYDRKMWVKKLRYLIAEKLPVPESDWHDFLADAAALGFEPGWVERQKRDAFVRLLRTIVADGVITGREHHSIELARVQIGLTEHEAESLLNQVVDEAEELLGREVEGG
jgi:hypothetical protein